MNILKKFSIRNLKLNKKRTISTVIGIILSVALICAVSTMVSSFQATLIENAVNETGYYHLKINNIESNDFNKLKSNRDIKEIYTLSEIGYGKLENGKNEDKPYLKLYSLDKQIFENLKFELIDGKFPENNNEIIISKHISTNGMVDYQIGDKININIGKRMTLDNFELYSNNPYNEEDEQLVDTSNYEFTVVGIIERPDYSFEDYGDPGYTIITTDKNKGKQNVYISLKNPKDYQLSIANMFGAPDYDSLWKDNEFNKKLNYESFSINNELLRWEAFAFSDDTVLMLYTVVGIVIFIILFTSIFCIRNSFAIATTEKMKMYGMLASVGSTKKQIKKNVIFEAMILGIIGIPIGILSGIFAVVVLIKIVNSLLGKYLLAHVDGISIKISGLAIILSVILGFLTIYLSANSSARRASKASPIDLLRNSDNIKIKAKKLKVPKVISKIFKTGGELAYKNLKRSKKKYRTTVISLAISIFIFITMNNFLVNAFDLSSNYYEDFDYNFRVYARENNPEDVEKIQKLNNINECFVMFQLDEYLKIFDMSKIVENPDLPLANDGYYDEEQNEWIETGRGKVANLQVVGYDTETFNKYLKKIKINPNKVKGKGILCDECFYYEENSSKQIETRRYNYSVGDKIVGEFKAGEKSFEIAAISTVKPYGIEKSYYGGGYFIVNLDEFKDLEFEATNMMIQSSNTEALEKEIKDAKIDVGISNLEESVKEEKAMVLVIKIFLYGFIAVITLIGVTNIFNTITSNMELRQKEFAMLKSIGMTKNEFNRMINLETIFYSSKALIYGTILGLLGSFALDKAFEIKLESGMYIPIKPIIISTIAVFVLVFVIMKYSMAKINKQNTIETIRNENI